MTAKVFGSVLVILGCGGWGFDMGFRIKREIAALREWVDILYFMKAELKTRITPLPILFSKAAKRGKIFTGFLQQVTDALDQQATPDCSACIRQALESSREIPQGVRLFLQRFGDDLGEFDLECQLNSLEALHAECQFALEKLEISKDQKVRTYQTIGLCIGTALTILFF